LADADNFASWLRIKAVYEYYPYDAEPRKSEFGALFDFLPSAEFETTVSDSDGSDSDEETVTVTIEDPDNITWEYDWTIVDSHEGLVAGDWAYYSTSTIGTPRVPGYPEGEEPAFFYHSGHYDQGDIPKDDNALFSQPEMRKFNASWITKSFGSHIYSYYFINAEAKAAGSDEEDYAKMRARWLLSRFKVTSLLW
jgi:hypothetical protein